jgi:hypothetical protein
MKRETMAVAVLVCTLGIPATTTAEQQRSTASPQADADVVTIDGSKDPAMVPDWAAWLAAFRFMSMPATPVEPIPTVIHRATTEAERRAIRKEAIGVIARETELSARGLELQKRLTKDNVAQLVEMAESLEMERRREALNARDRLLGMLSGPAQSALLTFVEQTRRQYRATVPRSELTQFMLPR